MRFRSLEDPEIKSSQELIILQIAGGARETHTRRVLVCLPDSYEDLVALSGETFGLSVDVSNVRFYTQELAGSKGINVEITKGAWDAIKTLLTSVTVELHDSGVRDQKKAPRKSIAPPLPDRVVTHDVGDAPTKDVIDAARRLSRMSLAPDDKRRRASRRSFVLPSPARPSKASEDRKSREPSVPPTEDDEEEDAEEEEEDVVFRSRGVGKRQVVASEDEEDEEVEDELDDELREEEAEGGVAEASFIAEEEDNAQQLQLPPSPPLAPQSPKQLQPLPPSPKTPASKVDRRSSPQRSIVSQAAPTPKVKQERNATASAGPKSVKKEKPEPPQRPQPGPDERFVVIIEYDDGSDEETQTMFKTRGRHTVSKVLMQACRTFGIEELYDKTQLVLAIDTEEDGEIVEHRFMCPKDETMANVGAVAESRFIVQVEDDL